MTVLDAINLPDDTSIEEITLTINKLNPPKLASAAHPEYGKEWFGQASDGTGKVGVIFKMKKAENNPEKYQGQTISIKTSHNRERAMTGIKLKHREQYRNIYITDSAQITVVGQGAAQPASTPAATGRTYNTTPSKAAAPAMTPEEYAKHVATCWCAVYDWTAEIFKTRLDESQIRECITSVVITMQRDGIAILPFTDRPFNWKDAEFKGKKLSEYTDDQLKVGYTFTLQGKVKAEDTVKAFRAAFESMNIPHSSVYGFLLNKDGIEDDTAETILLKSLKTPENMTDDDYKEIISNSQFFEEAKSLQAAKNTPFDDAETSLD
jgi:hypothetical protein